MDNTSQNGSTGGGATTSSDFVWLLLFLFNDCKLILLGAQTVQVRSTIGSSRTYALKRKRVGNIADSHNRMLEDPSYSSVVRWGDDGDSFVVLEVSRDL